MTTVNLICKKRLLGDMRLLKKDPHQYIDVSPDDKDILTWYFLIKGPDFSDFKNGYFIGKIMHNPEYPLKPPDFMMLTPNGRFDIGKKICLSNTGYHSSEWSAMWNVHAILTGFLSIMLDDKEHGISHIHYSKSEREAYANNSIAYNKSHHLDLFRKFVRFIDEEGNPIKEKVNITEKPKEAVVTEQPKESVVDQPKESVVEQPKESVVDQPKESVVDQPKESVVEQPKESVVVEQSKEEAVTDQPKKSRTTKSKKTIIFDPSTLKTRTFTKVDQEYKNLMKK